MHGTSSNGGNTMLRLRPISLRDANEYVRKHHRHHKPVAGHKFSIGCEADGELVGVIIAGRPVSRYLDDGFTLEFTRLCTNGARTLAAFSTARRQELLRLWAISASSPTRWKAKTVQAFGLLAGFVKAKRVGFAGRVKRQPKEDQYPAQMKLRYEKQLRKESSRNGICSGPEGS